VKSIFIVWLPIALLVTLTLIIILSRRDNANVREYNEGQHFGGEVKSEGVSIATEFKVIGCDSVKVTFGAGIPVFIRLTQEMSMGLWSRNQSMPPWEWRNT
jgi:hypothetical protein